MSRVRRAVPALALLSLVGLTGCGGGDSDAAPPSPSSPSSSASTSPSAESSPAEPTPPALPEAATRKNKAGAKAFVEHYWATVSYAQRTGDTSSLEGMSTDRCAACRGGVDSIRATHDSGGSIEGGDVLVLRQEAEKFITESGKVAFELEVEARSTEQVVSVPGEAVRTNAPADLRFKFFLDAAPAKWRISYWEVVR